jgi:hypothetical protein
MSDLDTFYLSCVCSGCSFGTEVFSLDGTVQKSGCGPSGTVINKKQILSGTCRQIQLNMSISGHLLPVYPARMKGYLDSLVTDTDTRLFGLKVQ